LGALVGGLLAFGVGVMATATRLDRDRAFYPTLMIVIGALYSLFAVMGGSLHALAVDGLIGSVFIAAALIGFRSSLWIVAVALAAHGAMDVVHHALVDNPGVPRFWPAFCSAYDFVAAAYLAWLIKSGRTRTAP
jgi:hypothetical protein